MAEGDSTSEAVYSYWQMLDGCRLEVREPGQHDWEQQQDVTIRSNEAVSQEETSRSEMPPGRTSGNLAAASILECTGHLLQGSSHHGQEPVAPWTQLQQAGAP